MFEWQITSLLQCVASASPVCGHVKAAGAKPAQFKETRLEHPSFLQAKRSRNVSHYPDLHHILVIYLAILREGKFWETANKNMIHHIDHDKQATNSAEGPRSQHLIKRLNLDVDKK